jgi:hypothetical protein
MTLKWENFGIFDEKLLNSSMLVIRDRVLRIHENNNLHLIMSVSRMDGLNVGEIKSPNAGHKSGLMCTTQMKT